MMREDLDVILQSLVALFVTLPVPVYLGLVHWPPGPYLLYSAAAGSALAAGDYLDREPTFRDGLRSLGADAFLRSVAITLLGGAFYLLAWLF